MLTKKIDVVAITGALRLYALWSGVTYSAMLAAAEATGDQAYYKYVTDRFQFLAEVAPHFRKVLERGALPECG